MTCLTRSKINLYYEELLYRVLPKQAKNRVTTFEKMSIQNFSVLKYHEYDKLLRCDYNIIQLKMLNREHRQKVSGNKIELSTRIYNFLRLSYFATKIQCRYKRRLQQRIDGLHGPAYFKRSICINECDFFTLDSCREIPNAQFFSFTDDANFTYGFDVISLNNLIIKSVLFPENPYNKKPLDLTILDNLAELIRLSRIMKINVEIKINNEPEQEPIQIFRANVLELFQFMDSLGNYTQINWFLDLSRNQLIIYIRALYDIWNYRAQLDNNVKRAICPPNGDPFNDINMHGINTLTSANLKIIVFLIMERLVKTGIDTDSKTLGAYYVLACFTLVNSNAAEAMPWLYQSVI